MAIEQQYGHAGRARLATLEQWLAHQLTQDLTVMERLEQVNYFFNQYRFEDDQLHWQQPDYWASPIEFVASGAGDCEDFTIAKYFTLRLLGIEAAKLRLMYVTAIELNQAHMVLLFLAEPTAMPLVLDNLTNAVVSGQKRTDLIPVYSFNALGVWRSRTFDQDTQLHHGGDGVTLWQALIHRMRSAQG